MTVTSVKESPVVHLRLTTKMSDRITEEETLQSICDEVKIFGGKIFSLEFSKNFYKKKLAGKNRYL